jgi:hypothetical protein
LALVIPFPRKLEYVVLLDAKLPFNFVVDAETVLVCLILTEAFLISTIID